MALKGVSKRFGGLKAIDDLSLDITAGEILGIAGPNGAGKTTLLNVCTGHLQPTSGVLLFEGRPASGLTPHRYCHLGIARTFQIPQVFASLSVEENVATGAIFGRAGQGRRRSERTTRRSDATRRPDAAAAR